MLKNISKHHYLSVFIFIILIKIFFWLFCFSVSNIFPLSPEKYFLGFHHFGAEPRLTKGKVDFFTLWIYSDAEWYLTIAEHGYPDKEAIAKAEIEKGNKANAPYKIPPGHPLERIYKYTEWDVATKYAFFPLYPFVISLFHLFLPLRVAAFAATNIISILAFFMLYSLVFLYFEDRKLAFNSLLLLIFYPFSAFYQAYFTEGLFLLLSVLSFYFLKKKMILPSVISGFLLCLTKATGIFITIPLLILMIREELPIEKDSDKKKKKRNQKNINWGKCLILVLIPLGLLPYVLINYLNTGHWNFFSLVLGYWGYENTSFIQNIINNILKTGLNFFNLHFLYFHESQVDYIVMLVFLILIIRSYKKLPPELWSFSFIIWLLPIISKDLMSFSRYMSVSFPIFIYLSMILRKDIIFYLLLSVFIIFNLIIHGMLINWYWVG